MNISLSISDDDDIKKYILKGFFKGNDSSLYDFE